MAVPGIAVLCILRGKPLARRDTQEPRPALFVCLPFLSLFEKGDATKQKSPLARPGAAEALSDALLPDTTQALRFGSARLRFGSARLRFGSARLRFGSARLCFGSARLRFGSYRHIFNLIIKRVINITFVLHLLIFCINIMCRHKNSNNNHRNNCPRNPRLDDSS